MDKISIRFKIGAEVFVREKCSLGHDHIIGPLEVIIVDIRLAINVEHPQITIIARDKALVESKGSQSYFMTREEAIKAGWKE